MRLDTVRLSDRAQDVFITAKVIDDQTIRLDISEAYNDSSTELTVDRATLVAWCRALAEAFDNGAAPGADTSPEAK